MPSPRNLEENMEPVKAELGRAGERPRTPPHHYTPLHGGQAGGSVQ